MDPETDPYEALRARIKATQEAVDRLARETGWTREQAASAAEPGPATAQATGETAEEMRALVALFELLRDVLPPDLRAQLTELIRQLLILVRAILDWWIERIGVTGPAARSPEPVVVEDIEIS